MAKTSKPSLAETHPEVAKTADGWDPSTVSSGTHIEMPWICISGHSFTSRVDQRTRGRGCPICAGKKVLPGFNDLASQKPEIAAQAYGWDPATVFKNSGKKFEWICNEGHVWECAVSERTNEKQCVVCNGKRVQKKYNDLSTTHPDLASRADGWDPQTVTAGSNQKMSWICDLGHKYQSRIPDQIRNKSCGVCAGRLLVSGVNDLKTTHPELAAQADGWDPTKVFRGSIQRVSWKCLKGHTWRTSVSQRSRLNSGCPACFGNVLVVGVNDLQTKFPGLAKEVDGWNPETVSAGSSTKLPWICKQGHKWTAAVHSRTTSKTGCPICGHNKVLPGFNDLSTTHPDIASQADGWDTTMLSAGSNKKVAWKCNFGHKWKSVVHSRALNGIGCPMCSGRKVLVGFNDLLTTNPELGAQANGWDAASLTKSSNKKVGWKCALGHTWIATVNNRTNGRDCPICSGKQVLHGFNDLESTHPNVAAEADGWDAKAVGKGSVTKLWWRCSLGHRWKATPNSRTQGTGCPTCAPGGGFDPNEPGFLYLIDHFDLTLFQIGITNFPDDRLGSHKRRGWEVIELRGPMGGHLTQQLETNCLHALEKRGAILGHKAGIDKFDGYSEAWTKASLNVTSIKQILDWVYEDETK